MIRVGVAMLAVLLTIYLVPFVVYGIASAAGGLKPPSNASAGRFLLGILVTKVGTAIAFVLLFHLTRSFWGDRWLAYAAIWFVMFACSEAGEAMSGRSTSVEAVLGIVSEAIYTPLATFIAHSLLERAARG